MNPDYSEKTFPSAKEDAASSKLYIKTIQTLSPTYRLAYMDHDFLHRDELRAVRLQLEWMKPELIQQKEGIEHTIVVFGSGRFPAPETARSMLAAAEREAAASPSDRKLRESVKIAKNLLTKSHYYEEARKLAGLISTFSNGKYVIITGGGEGIMEAANRGAHEKGAKTIGLNIVLPMEQKPNDYITPELCFQFHYFAIRKMHFLLRAKALVAFPGGFGTLDELFETLTLIQTEKIKPVPVLLFGRDYWERIVNFEALVEEGAVSAEDLDIFQYVETAEDALQAITDSFARDES